MSNKATGNFLSGKRVGEREGRAGQQAVRFTVRLGLGMIEGLTEIQRDRGIDRDTERYRSKETELRMKIPSKAVSNLSE
jgi:hypothetical protein